MNWKLMPNEDAIRTNIDCNDRIIHGLVYTCILTGQYKWMAWVHGDNIVKAVNDELYANVFDAMRVAESTMLSISDEIQSVSAIWQEV